MSSGPALQETAPRVAFVRSRYDPAGGAERFVQGAMTALRSEGAHLTLVTRRWPADDGTAIVIDPFHVGSLWRDLGFARAVCRELARRRFDIVQSHERIPCCDVYRAGDGVHARWLEERSRVQSGLGRMATRASPHHRYLLAAERTMFTRAGLKCVICNSELVRRDIAERFATPAEKLVLIRNAVDSDRFHPGLRGEMREAVRQQLGIPPSARVALLVGSGFERKGVDALLQSVSRCDARTWALVVGKDRRARQAHERARHLGIEARVRFAGAVSDVRPYYAAGDVFVLPALYDPFPNAVLEAMACGLPVVTTPTCGGSELLVEGENGFVRDALDIEGLANAIGRMEPDVASRSGESARQAVAVLTPQAMAREYSALYRRLLRQ